jgi:hypothetical protein
LDLIIDEMFQETKGLYDGAVEPEDFSVPSCQRVLMDTGDIP